MADRFNWHEYKRYHSRGYYDIVVHGGEQFDAVWGDHDGFHAPGRLVSIDEVHMIRRCRRQSYRTPAPSMFGRNNIHYVRHRDNEWEDDEFNN